eukprot:CAMPEP_0201535516 /NCGR_PEP_ID=MMETSP0161_2-20130828/59277_1 /ASSEMBLY_ACC=CAM_ASM_000251 /TAXON_ID=180227 /ORGANISM="Neoparamoeba aestuarina, Strain SoJaBio B1-5/56/2" /LENGTH=211 /DNA_ID=CAMNT_0047940747 /DNA_START=165 /DNA_END=800 /DNA_ORIENTATION=+
MTQVADENDNNEVSRISRLESEVQMWRERYQNLQSLRETEAETLLSSSLEKLEAHRDQSTKYIAQLKEENLRLLQKSSPNREEMAGEESISKATDADIRLLQFFKDFTGMVVTYCEDFELETKELNRRFSTATMERKTKPYKCLLENEEGGSSVSFLIWIENDEIEYRPLSFRLPEGRTPQAYFSEEIVFELDQGPSFLRALYTEVFSDDN